MVPPVGLASKVPFIARLMMHLSTSGSMPPLFVVTDVTSPLGATTIAIVMEPWRDGSFVSPLL